LDATQNDGNTRTVAVITGASSGIGAEYARALAARRYDIVLVARRRERLCELAAEISGRHGITAEVLDADLSRDEGIAAVSQRIIAEDRLGLLVNNAGFGLLGNFHQTSQDAQDRMYQVHVIATMRLSHAALPGLLRRDGGAIINVASVAGFTRMPGHASYAATKSWIIAFTECLHLEMRGAGSHVNVQALCPGYTYTEFHAALGVDRNALMPSGKFWMSAGSVVAESLRGLDRGKWLVIPGWRYRVLVSFLNHAPRALLHPLVTRVARRRAAAAPPKP
jgi:short-subunit dehydrogenase